MYRPDLRKVALLLAVIVGPALAQMQGFPDMKGHWAQDEVQDLARAQVVTGYPNGQFRPDAKITRNETVVMVLKALNIGPEARTESAAPAGAGPEAWARPYLERAHARGLIDTPPEQFEGGRPATRAELAQVVVRGFEKAGVSVKEPGASEVFNDVPDGAPAQREIRIAAANDLVKGYPNDTFRPGEPVTRAEAATMVARLRSAAGDKGLGSRGEMAAGPGPPAVGTAPGRAPAVPLPATAPDTSAPSPETPRPDTAVTGGAGVEVRPSPGADSGTALVTWDWTTLWARYAPWLILGLLLLIGLLVLLLRSHRRGSVLASRPGRGLNP